MNLIKKIKYLKNKRGKKDGEKLIMYSKHCFFHHSSNMLEINMIKINTILIDITWFSWVFVICLIVNVRLFIPKISTPWSCCTCRGFPLCKHRSSQCFHWSSGQSSGRVSSSSGWLGQPAYSWHLLIPGKLLSASSCLCSSSKGCFSVFFSSSTKRRFKIQSIVYKNAKTLQQSHHKKCLG